MLGSIWTGTALKTLNLSVLVCVWMSLFQNLLLLVSCAYFVLDLFCGYIYKNHCNHYILSCYLKNVMKIILMILAESL